MQKKIMLVFGTRPEAIKMCPLVLELKKNKEFDVVVCLTGQHREMLDQVMDAFGIVTDYNLSIMKQSQSLSSITSDVLTGMDEVLEKEKPDLVLVHGDTTTSMAAALSAFYKKIPVGHVEAGLRSGNMYSPYPEEMNRCITGRIANLHFAPTKLNAENLKNEGITENVFVTGNTVIDAIKNTVKEGYHFKNKDIEKITDSDRIILLTAHRRENFGEPLENICKAILRVVEKYPDVKVVYPVHPNPVIKSVVYELLGNHKQIMLTEPLDIFDMHNLMARSYIVMTDSGGLQEEAPFLGKPVLVLRTETERPEAVEAGTVRMAGIEADRIYELADLLLSDENEFRKMSQAVNPYGDGHACERIVEILKTMKSER